MTKKLWAMILFIVCSMPWAQGMTKMMERSERDAWELGFVTSLALLLLLSNIVFWIKYRKKKQKLNQLEHIISYLPMRFFVCDRKANLMAVSSGNDKIIKDLSGIKKIQYLPGLESSWEVVSENIRRVFQDGITRTHDFAHVRKEVFWKLPAYIFGQETVLMVSTDNTEIISLEKTKKDLQEQYNSCLNLLGVGVVLIDSDGIINFINLKGAELTGFVERSALNLPYNEVLRLDENNDIIAPVLDNSKSVEMEDTLKMQAKDGQSYTICLKAVPWAQGQGKPHGAAVIIEDVTAQKHREQQQLEKIKAAEQVFEMIDIGYFYDNITRRTSTYSDGMERLWPHQDGMPLPEIQWVYKEDAAKLLELRENLTQNENHVQSVNFRSNYFGEMRYYRLKAASRMEDGEKIIFGVVENITSINENERRFAKENELIRVLFDALPCPFFIKEISNQYRYVMCSDYWCELFDKSVDEALGHNDRELFDANVARSLLESDMRANAASTAVHSQESIPLKNGQIFTYHVIKVACNTADGRRMLFGMAIDVTKSHLAIKRERDLQAFFEKLLNMLPAGVSVKDVDNDFRYVLWNQTLEEHTGCAAGAVIGKTDFEIEPFVGMQQKFRDDDLKLLEQNDHSKHYHENLLTASGRTVSYATSKNLLENGGKRYIIELSLDTTHEDELEEDRKKSLAALNNFVTNEALINSCLKRITVENDFDRAVNDILQLIGNNKNADRAYVFKYTDEECNYAQCAYEWVREGILAQKDILGQIDMRKYPSWQKKILQMEPIMVDDVDNPPEDLLESMTIIKPQGIKSFCVVGIYLNGKAFGFFGVDFVSEPHNFTESSLRTLEDSVSIFLLAYQRKLQFDALANSTAVQKLIIDMMSIPVLLIDKNYNVIHANKTTCDLVKVKIEDCVGKACIGRLCTKKYPDESCAVYQTLLSKAPYTMEKNINGKDYIVNTQPIFQNGELIQVLETFTDVTEITKSKKLLLDAARDAEQAAQSKSMFLATISHELRTPLNAVIGFAELLQLGGMNRKAELEAIESIHFAGTNLLELINDVLDLSKLEAGQIKIVPEKMNLAYTLIEMRKLFDQKLKENNIVGENIFPPNLPYMYLDALRLRQVLLNLIGNAVKFTHEGGICVEVAFDRGKDNIGDLTITVKDTGDGIAPEYIKQIFEPFGQQDNRRLHVAAGTGLGLPICKRLLEQMGGELTVKSIVNKGSCFNVFIPQVRYEEMSLDEAVKNIKKPPKTQLKAKVLLVDDVKMNLKVMKAMGQKLNLNVETALSGREALEKIVSFRPDMVFTDMWMPKMNGAELAGKIKSNADYNNIKIVAITADSEISSDNKKYFDGVLLKPLTIDKLYDTIVSVLELN